MIASFRNKSPPLRVAALVVTVLATICVGGWGQQRPAQDMRLQVEANREGSMVQGMASAMASSPGVGASWEAPSSGVGGGVGGKQQGTLNSATPSPGGPTTGAVAMNPEPEIVEKPSGGRRPQVKQRRPHMKSGRRPQEDEEDDEDYYEDEASEQGYNGRRVNRDERQDRDHDDDDNCDEDVAYHYMEYPMRQMRRILNRALDGMGPPRGYPGGSMASASAFSSGDGYSRMSSRVSDNGRTRGIVSETRNGRTKVRRIGDDDDEEADDGSE